MNPLFALFSLGPTELIVIGVLGVLLFGRRLPEVGRYLGKGIVEFKKGMKGLEDELENSYTQNPTRQEPTIEPPRPPQRVSTTAPKFEPDDLDRRANS
jgi:sec-independent protein translocase protein TatA